MSIPVHDFLFSIQHPRIEMPEVFDFPAVEVGVRDSPLHLVEPLFEVFGLIVVYLGDLVRELAESSGNVPVFFVYRVIVIAV
jgi:hypothetical protein